MKTQISRVTKTRNRNPFVILSSEALKTMKTSLLNIETVTEYDDMLGVETLHPLVSVIDLSQAKPMHHMRHTFSFYVIFLKDEKNCDLIYGRQRYDYQKGSVVCLAPGQVIGIEDTGETFQPQGYALCFHPDLIRGTNLGRTIKEYTFFSYEVNEALHLSERERHTFIDCLQNIQEELQHSVDRMSKRLIANHIELLLNYCLRFYERQFITRQDAHHDILTRFRNIPGPIFHGRQCRTKGIAQCETLRKRTLPSTNYFWRPYQKRNRQNRPGIYTRQNYQHRQRTAASPLRVHQSDSLSTRFPVPAALHSCIQESHRNDSQ